LKPEKEEPRITQNTDAKVGVDGVDGSSAFASRQGGVMVDNGIGMKLTEIGMILSLHMGQKSHKSYGRRTEILTGGNGGYSGVKGLGWLG
jgi:hypothetical protein